MSQEPEFMDEIFQEAPEDTYEVRSLDFMGLPDHAVSNTGDVWNVAENRRIYARPNSNGYPQLSIKKHTRLVHRLVAAAFVENPKPDQYNVVDHIDCDPGNPNDWNLRWTDTRGNLDHQVEEGSLPPRISDETVHQICQDLSDGIGCTEISRKYDVSHDAVFQIKRGENWGHIAKHYDIVAPKPHNKRLTESQVIEICNLLNEGVVPQGKIAEMFGTSRDAINKISTGTNWKHITKDHLK